MIRHPQTDRYPQHVAIVMDGNGRWAAMRDKPRIDGYRNGIEPSYNIIHYASKLGIKTLTLFVLSRDNTRRPTEEINPLVNLFVEYLDEKVSSLIEDNIQIKFIGDLSFFDISLEDSMYNAESETKSGDAMTLNIAINYSGRWDIAKAIQHLNQTGKMPHTSF